MSQITRTDVNGLIEYTEKTGAPLSRSLIYKLVKNNEIPHKRIGTKIIFDIATVEKWLSEGEKQNEPINE